MMEFWWATKKRCPPYTTAITYPETYTRNIKGQDIKQILEDVCDNLFNPDPYLGV
ncbi:hypothetical protein QUF54_06025 [Candidatus Marithioploca araucensis]|uniref:Uncharacterized protein n=1 Tax=Candidatus Marithioploca araucensis TaxID=70273 RepID=A0ABT7VTJ2_9GAMM|nr:hypothetical protein [Candidatus Marithioploca araucensis]